MVQYSLEGKIAIITGGSSGIGYGIASALASRGTSVYLLARDLEKLKRAKSNIIEQGGKAEIRQADITETEKIKQIIEDIYKSQGHIDLFINNAGMWKGQTIGANPLELQNMRSLIRDSPTEITEYLINKFKNSEDKIKILTIISQAGLRFMENNLGYGTAKMGLTVNLVHLQGELERNNIQNIELSTLYPATVATQTVLPIIKSGQLQNATTLESVVNTALDIILNKTPTNHAYIGYIPGKGILRRYFELEITKNILPQIGEDHIIDSDFSTQDLIK